jgi:catechol 2,3-dioxygenase-like lactoylglutathione lyase family enzyme
VIPFVVPADSDRADMYTNRRRSPMFAASKTVGCLTLFVEDLGLARSFYSEVFAKPLVFEDPHCAIFDFGTTMINLLEAPAAVDLIAPAPVGGAHTDARFQLTMWVDDVDAACAELKDRGVSLLNGPMDRVWGQRTASFRDPAGTIWEIAKALSANDA